MDLKDVIEKVVMAAKEADLAFHAGHHEDAESILEGAGDYMALYFGEVPPRPTGVTESATTETPTEAPPATPAEDPGAPAQPAAVNPAEAARSLGTGSAEPKPPQ